MTTSAVYVGIDVAKATLDIAVSERSVLRAPNTRAGHRLVIERLQALPVACAVMESTGIYGRELARALQAAGIPVAVVQPGRVRHFALSQRTLAKTDRIDAMVIARFGAAMQPRVLAAVNPQVERLRAVSDRRSQVIDDRVREENRLEACCDKAIANDLSASIKRLRAREAKLDREIAQLIADDAVLAAKSAALQEEPGVGPQTAAVLLAQLPELGTVNRQQISALAGVAPYDHSSGPREGRRRICGGRSQLRRALYLSALSGARWNSHLLAMYQRLLAKGKDKKLALIACARKLIVRLNTRIADVLRRLPPETATA